MDLGIKNRTALICGASAGLGKACAEKLAFAGARIAIVSRREDRIKQSADELSVETGAEVHPITADLSTADGVANAVDTARNLLGEVDILVHNTGGPPAGTIFQFDDSAWLKAAELLVLSYIRLTRMLVPSMAERGWGRVVSITSSVVKEPSDELILSSAFRPGILAASKSLARQYGARNVLLNCILPGGFATERYDFLLEHRAKNSGRTVDEERRIVEKAIPVGHLGDPSALGNLAAFLCSALNTEITGAALVIDGSASKGLY